MKIRILRSSADREDFQFAASYVINDTVAIDAGSLGFSSLETQKRIRHVVLSHAHLDHIGSLPLFLDTVYTLGPSCPTIHASSDLIKCLEVNFFNDQVWPDIFRLASEVPPMARFAELTPAIPLELDGLRITPVPLNHVVPCLGFLIEGGGTAVAIVSDTGPTNEIWDISRKCTGLRAVFAEAAFPNNYGWLAERAKHLTPDLLLAEYHKLCRDVPIIVIHIKPAFHEQVVLELGQLGLPRLAIGRPDRDYQF